MFCLHVMCATYIPDALRHQKTASEILELELWVVMRDQDGCWQPNGAGREDEQVLLAAEPYP